ncbi:MAG: hypothetical protein DMD91_06630 [Candidatus Rokuibacteriota bacterium]|nr:MAG: hypothetical protein DMD91_06630 [Candidatus Rokubacteria bacterium]
MSSTRASARGIECRGRGHFTGLGQISATLNLLTFIAAHTKALRLGTAVLVLPWHNPVLLAEQAATLDLLSQGRLDFGIGMGYRYREFAGFCMPMEEAQERFDESLASSSSPGPRTSRGRGKYWQFGDVVVEPPTAQKPHLPLWMGAGSPIKKVAAQSGKLLLDQYASFEEIGERIALFRAAVEKQGRAFDPMSVGVTRSINVVSPSDRRRSRIASRRAGASIG